MVKNRLFTDILAEGVKRRRGVVENGIGFCLVRISTTSRFYLSICFKTASAKAVQRSVSASIAATTGLSAILPLA